MPGRGQTLWNGLSMDPIKNEIKLNTQELNAGGTASQKFYIRIIKPALDLFFATIGLIILSPLFLIISIAIKIDSRGPVFFIQERVGKDCKVFTLLKFRSMKVSPGEECDPSKDMERITRVGKFIRKLSIDEFPQLFNIVNGKMSFIGPRPLLVDYLSRYTKEQIKRHCIMPGMSGWAQVNGRNTVDWSERFNFDIQYTNNISFIFDLKIFFLTLVYVINNKGINNSANNTMSIFTGSNNKIGS